MPSRRDNTGIITIPIVFKIIPLQQKRYMTWISTITGAMRRMLQNHQVPTFTRNILIVCGRKLRKSQLHLQSFFLSEAPQSSSSIHIVLASYQFYMGPSLHIPSHSLWDEVTAVAVVTIRESDNI